MGKGKISGIQLTRSEASVVLGMVDRGDREHDIAAWFGVNQGRIAEVKKGDFGTLTPAPVASLPPKGPPGLKGRRLRSAIKRASDSFEAGGDPQSVLQALKEASAKYDSHET
jgi:hypothetical protein